ncbi:MAG: tRNA (adenosine(37)-N6)-dimethylallyltransferase MiaA [Bacilli bacterium]|nr:tRNA (adenosine(37)-N6)-dimethylallyltransferase MiaA [Bacilli bacterium]
MIFAILGPTASGKSDLAENIAKHFNAEVINFDAYQVYIEMNKGTAKPTKEFLSEHPNYHLYDFRHVDDPYNIMLYQKDGRELLKKYAGKHIVLVGGTGLYLKALLFDFKFLEEEKMPEDYLSNLTNEELYEELLKIDEADAKIIGPHNRKRLIRALYIYKIHNKSKTELNENGKSNLLYDDVVFIGLNPDRNLLYERINKRVEIMFEDGLVDEVNELKEKFPKVNQALQAIGYKEFFNGLDLESTKELIKKNTRNYAKRQMTFFKHQFEDVNWFENIDEAYEYATTRYR